MDLDGLVELRDLVEQALGFGAGASDLRAAVAHRAIDEPGADRVHPLHARQVDQQRVGLRIDLALDARGARNGQRAANAEWRISALGGGCRRSCHAARTVPAINLPGKWSGSTATFLPRILAFKRSRHGRHTSPSSCPSGPIPRGCSEWMHATRACRLAANMGLPCADEAASGPGRGAREHGLRLGPRLAAGDFGPARNGPHAQAAQPVLAHVAAGRTRSRSRSAMTGQGRFARRASNSIDVRERGAHQLQAAQARAAVRHAARSCKHRSRSSAPPTTPPTRASPTS